MNYTAGRELDALVAEKVMGWTAWRSKHGYFNITDGDGNSHTCDPATSKYDPETGERLPEPKWWDYSTELPDYSTDIAAAWPLVERFGITVYAPTRERHDWVAAIKIGACEVAHGETAPLAICLAALKAVGA